MTFEYASTVSAPVEEVYAWHSRPGAISRLTPPWQPVRVVEEATALRHGRAVLGLPLGLRWVAAHDPEGYDPPSRFVDELTSWPLRHAIRWRHSHDFEPAGATATRVVDRVDTTVPDGLLAAMFRYRHRQLADDLSVHGTVGGLLDRPLTVAMTGTSGLVGRALSAFLSTGGHRVLRLVRRRPRAADERSWRPESPADDIFDDVDAVVHLAGLPLAGRFTPEHKRQVRESRVLPTRRLAEIAARSRPHTLITASAIGYYGTAPGDQPLTEDAGRGDGFLAELVEDWEQATEVASDAGTRVVNVRTGIVQSPRGGMLQLLHPVFAAGLGGRLGSGRQWMSWIGIDDLVDVYYRALLDARLTGPVNAVSPHPVRNRYYTEVLGRVLRRPTLVPIPADAPRLLLGEEGSREIAHASQRVHPQRLLDVGHDFRHARLEPTLRHLLGRA